MMRARTRLLSILALAAGCGAGVEVGPDHPAHVRAQEVELARPSALLDPRATVDEVVPVSPTEAHQHGHHHGGAP